jgi:hypothetical protein
LHSLPSDKNLDTVGIIYRCRVVIEKEANQSLEAVAAKVNAGFEAGSVSRSDVANYIFLHLEKLISESDIKAIRALHFNEKKVLASILRGQDNLPEEVKKALRAHYGILDKDKKKTAKPQAEMSADIKSNSL